MHDDTSVITGNRDKLLVHSFQFSMNDSSFILYLVILSSVLLEYYGADIPERSKFMEVTWRRLRGL